MTPDVLLATSEERLLLEPGRVGQLEVQVRNTGEIVEDFELVAIGDGRDWSAVRPSTMSLLPGEAATATLWMAPPRTTDTPPGDLHVGVMARSRTDEQKRATDEQLVRLAPYTEVKAWLHPAKRTFRFQGRYRVLVANAGNADVTVRLRAVDPDNELAFSSLPVLRVRAGATQDARFRTRTSPVLRGPITPFPFSVLALDDSRTDGADDTGDEGEATSLAQAEGTAVRRAVFGPWVLRALAIIAVLGVIGLFVIAQTGPSDPATPAADGPPPRPSDPRVSRAGLDVRLVWDDAGGNSTVQVFQLSEALPASRLKKPNRNPSPGELQEDADFARVCDKCVQVAVVPAGASVVTLLKVPAGRQCYRLLATRGQIPSDYTRAVCLDVADSSLKAPESPAITTGRAGELTLSWTDTNGGSAGYDVLVDGVLVATTAPGVTSYTLTNQPAGANRCLQVRANGGDGRLSTLSPASPGACATLPTAPPPCAPVKIAPNLVPPKDTDPTASIAFGWSTATPAPEGTPAACEATAEVTTEVQVRESTGFAQVAVAKKGDTAVTVPNLPFAQDYEFRLRSVNQNGVSPWVPVRVLVPANPPVPTLPPLRSPENPSATVVPAAVPVTALPPPTSTIPRSTTTTTNPVTTTVTTTVTTIAAPTTTGTR